MDLSELPIDVIPYLHINLIFIRYNVKTLVEYTYILKNGIFNCWLHVFFQDIEQLNTQLKLKFNGTYEINNNEPYKWEMEKTWLLVNVACVTRSHLNQDI